ncbi:hypothetical protein PSACC_02092 [Paramicrosporidium saccamoebae]|uniref:Enoyl reductase (ER) domain-containing protein n=1 Tax=Paramicrosporidium saccamoebae TaxID=1246581 RepID=A0A2H9TK35_9FUNG|nr:hypothetical protein PSACC_02092 [Paramicrosporidium saccamoebae]
MKAVRVHTTGGIDKLTIEEIPVPVAKPGEVVVKNAFIGVNYIDIYHRTGLYPLALPVVLGREGSGVVESVGEGVSDLAVGDRVGYLGSHSYAEYNAVAAIHVVKLPAGMELEKGAACLLQGLTAGYLVFDSYKVQRGDFVVVPAAAGGTGSLICQLAKLQGATVIGIVSTEKKVQIAKDNGAAHVLLTSADITAEILKITGGRGAHVVYDGVGMALYEQLRKSLGKRGMYVSFGNAGGLIEKVNPADLIPKCLSFMRPVLFQYLETREEVLDLTSRVLPLIESGKLNIQIHKIYDFDNVAQAHQDLEGRGTTGKLLLKL